MMTLMTFWIIPIILLKIKVQVQKEVAKKMTMMIIDNTDNLQSKSTSIKKRQKETDAPPSSQIISELLKDDDILNDDDHGLNDDDEDAAEIGLIVKIHQNQIFKFKMT
jgi:hypothetical protein